MAETVQSLMMIAAYVVLGLIAGGLAGIIGIAGGVFIVPALVIFFHFTQKSAQGTTLAVLLPPIGIGAAYIYYRAGNVDIKAAIWIAAGFLIGGFFGAEGGTHLSNITVQRLFGVFLLGLSVKLLLFSK